MKYGIIVYKRKGIINIGDDMQLLAIKELYDRIGIPYENLSKIDFYDLLTYCGEEVMLPICFPLYGYNINGCVSCFSKRIKPLFLSLSLLYPKLNSYDIEYLKSVSPIGCRDEHTFLGLKRQGIDSYLNGCMTLTLKKRNVGSGKKVYCIDVYDEILNKVKEKFDSDVVIRSHIFNSSDVDTLALADDLLNEYAREARLIVTSRLHCALPCLAIGLPVVFVNKHFDHRFTWLEDILHVYTPCEWDIIDWNPTHQNVENVKNTMINLATKRLLGFDYSKEVKSLSVIYSIRRKRNYNMEGINFFKEWIREHWGEDDSNREFVVWGVLQYSSFLIDYIRENYKNAILTDVVDSFKEMSFYGLRTKKIEDVENLDNKYLFVCASAAARSAKDFALKNSISSEKICIWSTKGIL